VDRRTGTHLAMALQNRIRRARSFGSFFPERKKLYFSFCRESVSFLWDHPSEEATGLRKRQSENPTLESTYLRGNASLEEMQIVNKCMSCHSLCALFHTQKLFWLCSFSEWPHAPPHHCVCGGPCIGGSWHTRDCIFLSYVLELFLPAKKVPWKLALLQDTCVVCMCVCVCVVARARAASLQCAVSACSLQKN
jgi:hypothetical protein